MASVIGGFKVGSEEMTALVWICDKEKEESYFKEDAGPAGGGQN